MFRYKLNTYTAMWEIQLLRWGFFWVTLRGVEFGTLEEAVSAAGSSGISIHYQEQRPFNHAPLTTEQENAGVGSCG